MSLIKDSSIYLIGELSAKCVPFLLLPYLSRKLGVEGFGELSYCQTFLALFVIFIGLSQDVGVHKTELVEKRILVILFSNVLVVLLAYFIYIKGAKAI